MAASPVTPRSLYEKHQRSRATIDLLWQGLGSGRLARTDRVLVVAAGAFEQALFADLGFEQVTCTNIDQQQQMIDARMLPFADGSFDVAFVEAALHHIDKPHLAIYEMVRVSRRSVIICETQDHWLQRLMLRAGIGEEHEVSAVRHHLGREGGVNNSAVPNFVYRWAPGELEKVFKCLDPAHTVELDICYAWDLYGKGGALGRVACAVGQFLQPRLGNCFALHYDRSRSRLHPWLEQRGGALAFRDAAK